MRTTEGSRPAEASAEFVTFFEEVEPRLRLALVARFGEQDGREATLDALAYAWEHWDRLKSTDNPAGYLYRAAARAGARSRRSRARTAVLPPAASSGPREQGDFEPRLPEALASLSANQRTAVVLVHGWHYSLTEAAATLGMSLSTLRTHLGRGLSRLRDYLEVPDDQAD